MRSSEEKTQVAFSHFHSSSAGFFFPEINPRGQSFGLSTLFFLSFLFLFYDGLASAAAARPSSCGPAGLPDELCRILLLTAAASLGLC